MSARKAFFFLAVTTPTVLFLIGLKWPDANWLFVPLLPILLMGFIDVLQTKHTLRRIYPVVGRIRYLLESFRKEIQQYFVESDTNGKPASREFRSLIYQRAKEATDTRPFGTILDVNQDGYEWINHSLAPRVIEVHHPRVVFGGTECTQPYNASPLNISAMSFGSLSKTAISALNLGAQTGGFAHNTGEGGISEYHLEHDGDIIWQIGTGYFGCRNKDGFFDPDLFTTNAARSSVKMIEVKLSQGAKPGHGGILPAIKLTQEIAKIRHVPMGKDVISPAAHSRFSTPKGLLEFIKELRQLSGGKPVGFKLCIGKKSEFIGICKAMLETGITPDFITVDGGEGGTGAAPAEFTNSTGTPLRDALIFVNSALIGTGLRDKIKLVASGKVFSAFHLLRILALGADTVNSARGMMFALGCLQSRSCNNDKCPTGIATQDPSRYNALNVQDKGKRVANFHHEMIRNLVELLSAMGLESLEQLRPEHINRRVKGTEVKTYQQLYPFITDKCLLSNDTIPESWKNDWEVAKAESWQ